MKKIITLCLSLILVMSCIALPVSAAGVMSNSPSPEGDGIISNITAIDAKGNKASIEFIKRDTIDNDLKPTADTDKIIAQYDVKVIGTVEYPVTITADVKGIKKDSKAYILAKNAEGKVEKLAVSVTAEGKIEFKFDKEYKIISLIADKATTTQVGTSDKTGDVATPIVAVVMVAALAGMVASRKIKED